MKKKDVSRKYVTFLNCMIIKIYFEKFILLNQPVKRPAGKRSCVLYNAAEAPETLQSITVKIGLFELLQSGGF